MNQSKKHTKKVEQFLYLNRWVDKEGFRAFVYDIQGNQQLANSHKEFESLTSSGLWFATKPVAEDQPSPKKEKPYGSVRTTS